jgi:hypothetical protein
MYVPFQDATSVAVSFDPGVYPLAPASVMAVALE